jgi:hypothetical protein
VHDLDTEDGRRSYLRAVDHLAGKPTEYKGMKESTERGESAVLRFSKSMRLANRRREDLVRAIGSRDPNKVRTARREAADQQAVVRRQVARIKESTVLGFSEFLAEGAHDYVLHVKSDKESDVTKHWEAAKKSDRAYNGHQDGYSGDSQTFGGRINYHRHVTHKDYNAAYDHVLKHHEKWDGPVAVKFRHTDGKIHHLVGGWAAS